MARQGDTPPGVLLWLAAFLLVVGTGKVTFGLATVLTTSPVGAVDVVLGALLLLEAAGVAWTRPWGLWLGVGVHGLSMVAGLVLFALLPSAVTLTVVLVPLELALLLGLLANRRHFERRPIPGDPLPTGRTAQFESIRDGWFDR